MIPRTRVRSHLWSPATRRDSCREAIEFRAPDTATTTRARSCRNGSHGGGVCVSPVRAIDPSPHAADGAERVRIDEGEERADTIPHCHERDSGEHERHRRGRPAAGTAPIAQTMIVAAAAPTNAHQT